MKIIRKIEKGIEYLFGIYKLGINYFYLEKKNFLVCTKT